MWPILVYVCLSVCRAGSVSVCVCVCGRSHVWGIFLAFKLGLHVVIGLSIFDLLIFHLPFPHTLFSCSTFSSIIDTLPGPVVPWDRASPRWNQSNYPGGEPWSAVQRHSDGRQGGQGTLCACRGGVCERREVSHGTEDTPILLQARLHAHTHICRKTWKWLTYIIYMPTHWRKMH